MSNLYHQALKDKCDAVIDQLMKMQAETGPILAKFLNLEVTQHYESQYECGNYSRAAEYLHFLRFFVTPMTR